MTVQDPYVLGSGEHELARLDAQSEYYRPTTVDAMRWAGVRPGMRVLDLGSGTGGVALLAARLVGPSGSVLGVDRDPVAVRTATRAAEAAEVGNASFVTADLTTWASDERFDLITGRFITLYLPRPAEAIARLVRLLRPDGVVLLQEVTISATTQVPETTLFRRTLDLVKIGLRTAGIALDLGLDLDRVFDGAGLPRPTMMVGGRWEPGPDAITYTLLTAIARTLLPIITAHGIATDAEVEIDTLEQRLRNEAAEAGSAVGAPLLISAWARLPSVNRAGTIS
jgi:SAM-dependent methyltransferase